MPYDALWFVAPDRLEVALPWGASMSVGLPISALLTTPAFG